MFKYHYLLTIVLVPDLVVPANSEEEAEASVRAYVNQGAVIAQLMTLPKTPVVTAKLIEVEQAEE